MTNIRIGLGIPTINRLDLLQEALVIYENLWQNHPVIIVDNGNQRVPQASWYQLEISPFNRGVAESWNFLIDSLFDFGCSHALILNDDIVFDKSPEQVEEMIGLHQAGFFKGTQVGADWSAYVIAKSTFRSVGKFSDLFYPAYFEDNDYEHRMSLFGITVETSELLNPVIFRNSQTIAKNPELNSNFGNNYQKYLEKWGGPPRAESYNSPYNK